MTIHIDNKNDRITTAQEVDKKGVVLHVDGFGTIVLPKGRTIERPSVPVSGDIRFNKDTDHIEFYTDGDWHICVYSGSPLFGSPDRLVDSSGNLILMGMSLYDPNNAFMELSNAPTGSPVVLSVSSPSSTHDMEFVVKGNGAIRFGSFEFGGTGPSTLTFSTSSISTSSNMILNTNDVRIVGSGVTTFGSLIGVISTAKTGFTIGTSTFSVFDVLNSGMVDLNIETHAGGVDLVTLGDLIMIDSSPVKIGNSLTINQSNLPDTRVTTFGSACNFATDEKFVFMNVSSPSVIDFGMKRVTNVNDPIDPYDAANKKWVDAAAMSLLWKRPVVAATTSNLPFLSGLVTIDGVTLVSGDRVLVKDQVDPRQNGIYVVSTGVWSRSSDADTGNELRHGSVVYVENGVVNGNTSWIMTTLNPVVIGTSPINWTLMFGSVGANLEGMQGFNVTLSGQVWQLVYDVDNYTITAGTGPGGKLSVYAPGPVSWGSVLVAPSTTPGVANWSGIDLSNPNSVTGALPVNLGGTGVVSAKPEELLVGTGGSVVKFIPVGTSGQFSRILTSGTSNEPRWWNSYMTDMEDVSISAPTSGELLLYDGTVWYNTSISYDNQLLVDSSDRLDYLGVKIEGVAPITTTISAGISKSMNIGLSTKTNLTIYASSLMVAHASANKILVSPMPTMEAVFGYGNSLRDSFGNTVLRVEGSAVFTVDFEGSSVRIVSNTGDTRFVTKTSGTIILNNLIFPASGVPESLVGTQAVQNEITFVKFPGGNETLVFVYTSSGFTFTSANNLTYTTVEVHNQTVLIHDKVSALRFDGGMKLDLNAVSDVSARLYITEYTLDTNVGVSSEFMYHSLSAARLYKTRLAQLYRDTPGYVFIDKRIFESDPATPERIGISAIYTLPTSAAFIEIIAVGGGGGGSGNVTSAASRIGANGQPGTRTLVYDIDTGGSRLYVSAAPGVGGIAGAFSYNDYPYTESVGKAIGSNVQYVDLRPGTLGLTPAEDPGSDAYNNTAGRGGRSGYGTGGGAASITTGFGSDGARWGGGGGGVVYGTAFEWPGWGGMGGGCVIAGYEVSGITQLFIELGDGGIGGSAAVWTSASPHKGGDGAAGMVMIKVYKKVS